MENFEDLQKKIEDLNREIGLYKEVINQLPIGIQLFDKDGTSCYTNPKQTEFLKSQKPSALSEQYNILKDPHTFRQKIIPVADENSNSSCVFTITEDITELIEAKKRLKQCEENYQNFVTHSPDILYKFSNKRGSLFWSHQVKEILGYDPAQLKSDPFIWKNSIHPDDIQRVKEEVENYEKGGIYSVEYRIKSNSGKWVWLHDQFMYKSVIDDEIVIEGHASDITKRKELEIELEEAKQRFELAMQSTKDGLWDWNLLSNEIYLSPNWKSMLGYKDEELENSFEVWQKLVHPMDKEETNKTLREHLEGKKDRFDIEFRMKHKNGNWIDILSRGNCYFDSKGKPYRLIGTHIDISQRKHLKKALADSELRWKFAIEGNKDGLWDWDIKTNRVFFSTQWKKMLGFSEHEIGNTLEEWDKRVHPDDKERTYEDIAKHIKGETEYYKNEHRVICKNGTYKWILDRGIIIERDVDGQPVRMIGTHTDITERKKHEKYLFELNRFKDKVFSIITHDLRSPFNAILGLNEIVINRIETEDYNAAKEITEAIYKTTQQTLGLLDNLLYWSRMQTGKFYFKPSPLELNNISKSAIEYLKLNLTGKKISIKCFIPDNFMVVADRIMLETILRNLLQNAIKFSYQESTIELHASRKDKTVEISVIDYGIGINKGKIEKLFDVSEEFTSLGTNQEKGTGLGLVVCKEFIEKHNGKIWVESEVQKGTKFTFTIAE